MSVRRSSIRSESIKTSRKSSKRKALILGERCTALIIARQLEEEGFEPLLQDELLRGERLPSLADPDNLQRLRRLLGDFALLVEHSGIVHPGVTAWAERSEFPIIAEEFGLTAVCPPSRVLSLFSNKLNLLQEAQKLGVPNAILSFDPIYTTREIDDFVESTQQKLPFVLKAVKGRGSTSLFVAKEEETLKKDLTLWFEQLRRNVGEVILFAEKYVDGARHLVVPFSRFQDGRIWTFPLTDISLQCRYRKVIEFCPARQVTREVTRQLIHWTRHLAQEFGYVGVGAFEFLVDGSSAYLIEGLARLNAGFHLWESVAGTSAVSWQIAALDFHTPLVLPQIKQVIDSHDNLGFGISARIYAEDPVYHLPQPGYIHEIRPMDKPVRDLGGVGANQVDLSLRSSDLRAEYSLNYGNQETVSSFDSGIIGLFFVYGASRLEVLSLIRQMICDFWIVGTIKTNQRFLFELLQHPWIEEEIFYAGFVDDEYVPNIYTSEEMKKLFINVSCSLPEIIAETQPNRASHSVWYVGERRIKTDLLSIDQARAALEWTDDPKYWNSGTSIAFSGALKLPDGQESRVCVYPLGDNWMVRIGFWFNILRKVAVDRNKKDILLKAMNAGRIHAILFLEGSIVPAHEPLLTLEAFGVLVPHALPVQVRVMKWQVKSEDSVQQGQDLAQLIVV